MPTRKSLYISRANAIRIIGCEPSNLRYHARRGNIRTIQVKQHGQTGELVYRYHIDDVQALSWPTGYDIAKALMPQHKPKTVTTILSQCTIRGAVKLGQRWRYPPDIVPKLVKWYLGGRPVTVDFRPMRCIVRGKTA